MAPVNAGRGQSRRASGAETRDQIIAIATELFVENGYEATAIEAVLQRSGLSRGALYHHFANKEAVFRAVLDEVETRVAQASAQAAQGASNPLDALRAGCAAWLALARDPVVRRVVLIDAPSVVGWQAWREIDDRHALGLLKSALGAAASAGRLSSEMVDTNAHLLLAALIEMALLVARAKDAATATHAAQQAIEELVSRMLGAEPHGSW